MVPGQALSLTLLGLAAGGGAGGGHVDVADAAGADLALALLSRRAQANLPVAGVAWRRFPETCPVLRLI